MIVRDENIFDKSFDGYWRVVLCTLSRRWSGQFGIMEYFWRRYPLAWRWWKERLIEDKYYVTVWQMRKAIMFPCGITNNVLFGKDQIEENLYELNKLAFMSSICFPGGVIDFNLLYKFLDDRFIFCSTVNVSRNLVKTPSV